MVSIVIRTIYEGDLLIKTSLLENHSLVKSNKYVNAKVAQTYLMLSYAIGHLLGSYIAFVLVKREL